MNQARDEKHNDGDSKFSENKSKSFLSHIFESSTDMSSKLLLKNPRKINKIKGKECKQINI